MKSFVCAIAMLALALVLKPEAGADQRRIVVAPRTASGVTFLSGGGANRVVVYRQIYGAYPYYYYQPYYPQVVVISPYAPAYLLAPAAVNAPYFCLLDNQGFVSRVGLLDHLAGTHKIPLDAAMNLCPDGGASCVFPSY